MFSANDFIPTQYSHSIERNFQWSAPSNIALVKYWKKENQIPANPG
jgi:diphosphomevalonate decarboxylase